MKEVRLRLLEDAAAFYTELINSIPAIHSRTFEMRLRRVHALLGKFNKIEVDLEKAIELNPNGAEFHRTLAAHLTHCSDIAFRDPNRGIVHATRAVELAPSDSYSHLNLVIAYKKLGSL